MDRTAARMRQRCAPLALGAAIFVGVVAVGTTSPIFAHSVVAAPTSTPGKSIASILSEFAKASDRQPAYTALITVYERQGERHGSMTMEYVYRRPTNVTVHIVSGKNRGATLVWEGGPTVTAHRGSGFMAMFKKKFDLHDPTTTSVRGSSIDQLRFDAILANLRDSREAALTVAPLTHSDTDGPTYALVRSTTHPHDGEINREEFVFSEKTHLPEHILGYENGVLVRNVTFANVVPQ